jgi:flavin reductase (DIM6/NTAB) family NADH-FMN oxidoreductase RutF
MAVGSFTSVSLDPPLVAFLPDRNSSTFPLIRETGNFCVNILAGGQEEICRGFATKKADRFEGVDWRPTLQTGSPILDGAIAWIDCEIAEVHDAGDHQIVIGRVLELEMASPALPLLFFQGGYGTFTLRTLVLATRGVLNEAARTADAASEELERLSIDLGLECRVFAQEGNEVVIVAATGYEGPADRVGVALPFHPPFATTLAAWGSPEVRDAWLDASPVDLSTQQRESLRSQLDGIRSQGWTLSMASEATDQAEQFLNTVAEFGRTPRLERQMLDIGRRMTGIGDPSLLSAETAVNVRTIAAPILTESGLGLQLTLHGFKPGSDLAFVKHARDLLKETSQQLTRRFGGSFE